MFAEFGEAFARPGLVGERLACDLDRFGGDLKIES
jgi:hypothetical protein